MIQQIWSYRKHYVFPYYTFRFVKFNKSHQIIWCNISLSLNPGILCLKPVCGSNMDSAFTGLIKWAWGAPGDSSNKSSQSLQSGPASLRWLSSIYSFHHLKLFKWQNNKKYNLKSGFSKASIYPFRKYKILTWLGQHRGKAQIFSETFYSELSEMKTKFCRVS